LPISSKPGLITVSARTPLRRRKWWQRHHRNYYRVRTSQGEVFEIYYDRGTSLKHPEYRKWYLHRQL